MRTLFCLGLFLCLLINAIFAEEKREYSQPYIVLATVRTNTIKKQLTEAAAQGYHVVAGDAANNILVLEKGQASDLSDYLYFDNLFRGMKEAAAQGYRLLPKTLGTAKYSPIGAVMEKVSGNVHYEYKILDTIRTSSFQKDLSQAAAEGWQLVGLQSEDLHYGVLERPTGEAPPTERRSDRYLLLATKRPSTMQKELDDAAARGYRVAAATAAEEMIIVLERPGAITPTEGARYEYQVLSMARSGTLEKEINVGVARGFHVLPNTLSLFKKKGGLFSLPTSDELALIIEKDPKSAKAYEYRLLGTRRVGTLERELNETIRQGFKVAGMMLSHQEQLILMERQSVNSTDGPPK